jgi:hypothetical protein
MINKLIWLLVGIVVGILLTTYSVYMGPSSITFKQTIDSLNNVIDSNKAIADAQNIKIIKLAKQDSMLAEQVTVLTKERNKARAEADKKANNPNLSNSDTLRKFFVERYPTEDKTPFSLPKESVVNAARDLIYCDGDRKDLFYADSTNTILNKRINTKDSTIYAYQIKDTAQQTIISSQDVKYNVLEKEYTKINRQNKFLKLYIKTTFVAATIAATVTLFIVK